MSRQLALPGAVGTAALAGLLFGFDTAVIAGITGDLTRLFGLSPGMLGLTVSAALWGTLIGALVAGKLGDTFGSRNILRALAIFYVAAGLGGALAPNWPVFVVLRFVCGLAIGGSSVLAPAYITDISPAARRGFLVGMFQLMIVGGILLAYASNAAIGSLLGGATAWRWKIGVSAAPAILFFLLLFAIPNSPRWLISQGRYIEARDALRATGSTDSEGELHRLTRAIEAEHPGERLSWTRHRRPMILAILIATFNQLAGINAVLYYLNDIVAHAGAGSPDRQAVLIGLANVIFTIVGLVLIDRIGRRALLMVGAAGMALCLGTTSTVMVGALASDWLLPALVAFIAFFATSQGAVIWVYISEIFPTPVRARGSALGASTHWALNAIVAAVFPALAALSAAIPFAIFAIAMVVQLFVVALLFPETRGRDVDAVASEP